MRWRGNGGELRAGARVAARLASWDIVRLRERLSGGQEWAGTAVVVWRDRLWSASDGAYDLVVPVGPVRWVWRGVAVAWDDGRAALGGAGGPEVRA